MSPVETTPRVESVSKEYVSPPPEKDSPELFTPVSSGRRSSKNGRPSSGKAEKARTRLLGRFETASSHSQESGDEVQVPALSPERIPDDGGKEVAEEKVESSKKQKQTRAGSVIQPVPSGRAVKGGWANLPKM